MAIKLTVTIDVGDIDYGHGAPKVMAVLKEIADNIEYGVQAGYGDGADPWYAGETAYRIRVQKAPWYWRNFRSRNAES